MSEDKQPLHSIVDSVKRYITYNIDYARLTVTEKLAVLLSSIAFYCVAGLTVALTIIFLSLGVGHLLADTIAPIWAYVYVGAFYVLLLVLLIVFRQQLFINPITRFVSRLMLDDPAEANTNKS